MKIMPLAFTVMLGLAQTHALAASDDPFAELEEATEALEEEGSEKEMNEFQQWKAQYMSEYQAFRQAHFKKLDVFRDELMGTWGDSEVSSNKQYVEYSDDQNIKTVLDYEKNEIRISVLHEDKQKVDKSAIKQALGQIKKEPVFEAVQGKEAVNMLDQFVGERFDGEVVNKYIQSAKKRESAIPLTQNQQKVFAKEVKLIEEQSNAQNLQIEKLYDLLNAEASELPAVQVSDTEKSIAEQKRQIEQEKQQRIAALRAQTARLTDNTEQRNALRNKKITTFTIPLSNKKDLTKAKPFIPDVMHQSERWELSPSLMLAIMHTESYFNPKAESHIPAFGLMQIVPRTAGVDVNRFLYNKDKPMIESYLLHPESNIETGVAYMHILNSKYLKKITNPESRMYCMIAAYNTGSGNVAKTFNRDGSRNINKAAPIINSLSPRQVYQALINNLPYDETKDYVKRVVDRKSIYLPVEGH